MGKPFEYFVGFWNQNGKGTKMSCKLMPILIGNVNLQMLKILQKKKVETDTRRKMIFLTNQITIDIKFQLFPIVILLASQKFHIK